MLRDLLFSFLLFVLLVGFVSAGDFYVDINVGSNSNSGTSPQDPWKTIAFALDSVEPLASASNPATINIAEGIHSPETGEEFTLLMRSYVSLQGAGAELTILDAMYQCCVVLCLADEVKISDLTIAHGQNDGDGGGFLVLGSSPIVRNCVFRGNEITTVVGSGGAVAGLSAHCHPIFLGCQFIDNNSKAYGGAIATGMVTAIDCIFECNVAGEDGGAVEINMGKGIFVDCAFFNNRASMGGAIHGYRSDVIEIRRCEISHNSAYDGGGINFNDVELAVIEDTKLLSNYAQHDGGGMLLHESSPLITNCLIANNMALHIAGGILYSCSEAETIGSTIADNKAGLEADGVCCSLSGPAKLVDCILWGNPHNDLIVADVSYSNIDDQMVSGIGNISQDPLFVSGWGSDYLLSQVAAGQSEDSPCVGAGSAESLDVGMHYYSTRSDNAPDLGTVDMGYHVPVAMPRVDAWCDREYCSAGFSIRPIALASNKGPHAFADVYAGFFKPTGEWLSFTAQGLSVGLSPWISNIIVEHGFQFGPQILLEYNIPADWENGEYFFFLALCAPGTTDTICKPSIFQFSIEDPFIP